MKCNYHTHSTYCDGKEPLRTFIEKAIELHYDHLGFSSHAPIDFRNDFAIKEEDIPHYILEIEELQKDFPNIQLFTALECDFIPGISKPFNFFKKEFQLDYIIGGVHLVGNEQMESLWFIDGSKREIYDEGLQRLFHSDIKKGVTAFWEQTFQMIEEENFDIIAHLDKIKMHNQDRYFVETEPWYRKLALHALSLIKKKNIIVEINSRGLYKGRCNAFYPSSFLVQEAAKMDIPFVISSDAHISNELPLYYEEATDLLKANGIHQLVSLQNGEWNYYDIN